jgi:hypothetical protein
MMVNEEINKPDLRFTYLRDPSDFRRVLTIARRVSKTHGTVEFAYTVNKIEPKKNIQLDQRLRDLMSAQDFSDLQRKFKSRFKLRNDQHHRKQARAVATGRFIQRHFLIVYRERKVIEDILEALAENKISSPVPNNIKWLAQAILNDFRKLSFMKKIS